MKCVLCVAVLICIAVSCLGKPRPKLSRAQLRQKYAQFLKYRQQIKTKSVDSAAGSSFPYKKGKLSQLMMFRRGKTFMSFPALEPFHLTCIQ